MKQPILTLILLGLAFVTGYELKQLVDDRSTDANSEATGYLSGGAGPQAGRAGPPDAQTAAGLRDQERLVEDLRSQMEEHRKSLDELNQKLNRSERTERNPQAGSQGAAQMPAQMPGGAPSASRIAQEMSQTRAQILALEQKQEQSQQREVSNEVRDQERRLTRDLNAAQLRRQLSREQALSNELNRQVRHLVFLNVDTDTLRALETRSRVQAERVKQLQAQYQSYLYDSAAETAVERVQDRQQAGSAQLTDSQGSPEDQIRQAKERLEQLEKDHEAARKRELGAQAASEVLNERYLQLRGEYDDLVRRYDDASRDLAEMKSAPATSE